MKQALKFIIEDILKEDVTVGEFICYGIIAPTLLVLAMGVAGWLETAV